MTKKPIHHPSLQELTEGDDSLKGMMDTAHPSWGARKLKQARDLADLKHVPESVKELIRQQTLGKYGEDTVSRAPTQERYFDYTRHQISDPIPTRVVTKTRSI